jgi:hypothetical protein
MSEEGEVRRILIAVKYPISRLFQFNRSDRNKDVSFFMRMNSHVQLLPALF